MRAWPDVNGSGKVPFRTVHDHSCWQYDCHRSAPFVERFLSSPPRMDSRREVHHHPSSTSCCTDRSNGSITDSVVFPGFRIDSTTDSSTPADESTDEEEEPTRPTEPWSSQTERGHKPRCPRGGTTHPCWATSMTTLQKKKNFESAFKMSMLIRGLVGLLMRVP
jgi:hypothetical protein